ncbi:hypothetical protein ACO0RG_000407 [Hanseniaspora osmophila]|uniref:ER membrane protein complex subunit 4 n=1 Tax=Hanseniaspora osmophila TaxID=56408 RepID=A0A1E5R1P8_9ASCO|nr:ER membrane protein complex subunit 4 [Hanseniaspora osmophila]
MSSQEVPQWVTNLTNKDFKPAVAINTERNSKTSRITSPPGFQNYSNKAVPPPARTLNDRRIEDMLIKKAWAIAMNPAKSIPMNLIMSYFSGSSLQIMSIITTFMMITGPIKSIITIKEAFKPVLTHESIKYDVKGAMAMFVVFQLLTMGIAVYKLNAMGLFPNTKSDWLAWEAPAQYVGGRSFFV